MISFTPSNKIVPPVLPSSVLHRESLISRLRVIITAEQPGTKELIPRYKLILLCAPAGYGKTTLLADFAQSTAIPCCWYFLDQSDTDRFTFLSTLLASIRHRFPAFGAALDPLLIDDASALSRGDDSQRFNSFIHALLRALETDIKERFVLLLCNYHEVNESPAIAHLINQLLRSLPSHCVLLLESRATPSIEVASLLAHREAIGWGSHMLRMSAQEILELARVQGVAALTETEAHQLAVAFDGWIAGILLGTRLGDTTLFHASTRTGILQGLPFMRVEREKLFVYLVNEIFEHQPDVYAFIKEAAVLQQMTPALCDALLGISSATEHLERLARQGMFVNCSDDGPQPFYTCHPVLRELLCDELLLHFPQRFVALHQRAAELFEMAHDYENSIAHALAAGDGDKAAKLIIHAHHEMSSRKYTEVLLRWIDALPPETIERYPQLLLIRASIHLIRNEYLQALPLLDTASVLHTSTTLTNINLSDLPRLQAELMFLRSKAFFQEGRYQEAQRLCEQLLETTPMDEITLRAEAHTYFGMCATLLGELTVGLEHLQKALQLWGRNTVRFQVAEAHSTLANIYYSMGNFALAEHHLTRAITCWEHLHDEKGKANTLFRMGIYKHHQGALAEAETIFTQALSTVQGTPGFERIESYILDNLGTVYQDQGRYNQSLQTLEHALDLARQMKDNYLVNFCLCNLAMTYLRVGDASTALLLLSETNLPPLNGNSIGQERATHDLAYGTILLYQHDYNEAYACFTALEMSLQKSGFKCELLLVKLGLAAYHLACQKPTEAVSPLDEMTPILERHDYGQFIFTRLSLYPEVFQLIKTLPTLERLRNLLQIPAPTQKTRQKTAQTTPAPALAVSSQPKLRIQAFGEPAVFLDERPITRWRMARSMELFFFLLDCGRPMRKEQIITALWPHVDEQINQTFHSTVYYLRKALNESYLVSQAGIYSLDLSSSGDDEVQYDIASFQEQYAQAKRSLAHEDHAAAKASLLTTVAFYQGDYVQPFYSDWCSLRRDELRRSYLEARNHLADIAWRQEVFDESAVHWQHMLAIDNCLEEAHYGLMKYYTRKGKRSLALRQYQRCVETLQQELAVRPGAPIQNLYQRLLGTSNSEQMKKSGRTSPLSENGSRTR